MKVSYLSSLERRLANLKYEKKECERELDLQKRRARKVEDLERSLRWTSDGSFDGVNRFVGNVASTLVDSVKLANVFVTRGAEIGQKRESDISGDPKLSQAMQDISRELNRVREKIDSLQNRIAQLDRAIDSTRDEISREKRRIAMEAIREAAEKAKQMLEGNS